MAKDGTMRGGARANSGPKSEDRPALSFPTLEFTKIPKEVLAQFPKCDKFLSEKQEKIGTPLGASSVYYAVYYWMQKNGDYKSVPPKLVEQYAMAYARWRQAEREITKYGFLAAHPTTGQPIASPLMSIKDSYFKEMQAAWFAIYQAMKESGGASDIDGMEGLLS